MCPARSLRHADSHQVPGFTRAQAAAAAAVRYAARGIHGADTGFPESAERDRGDDPRHGTPSKPKRSHTVIDQLSDAELARVEAAVAEQFAANLGRRT